MALTRGATGHATPRVLVNIDTAPANPRKSSGKRTTKKKTTTLSKPKTGVKKRAPNATHKRKTTLKDKIAGTAKKAVGKVERKPGKVGAGTKKIKGTDGKGARTAKK